MTTTERSQLTRQHQHYRAVRERLMGAAGRPVAIAALERQLAELATENAASARRIAALEIDLADAEARLLAQAQTLLSARTINDGEGEADGDGRLPIADIVAAVLKDFPGIGWEDILSVRRERRLVEPRHACMRAVYENRKDLSLPLIGRIFRRDHTSVLAVVQKNGPTDAANDP